MKARANVGDFRWFSENYLSMVMGRTKNSKGRNICNVCKMLTASDEALVIVCMESNHARWTWEAKSDEERDDEVRPRPKYTDSENKSFRYGGWTEEGIARYNELTATLIPALQKKSVIVETQLREIYVLEAQERSGKRKQKEVVNKTEIVAVMEDTTDKEENGMRYTEDDSGYNEHGSNNGNEND